MGWAELNTFVKLPDHWQEAIDGHKVPPPAWHPAAESEPER